MAAKQELYIRVEHEWLEEKVKQLKNYIDANPVEEIDDRIETVTSSKGIPAIKVIAKKEEALKAWINALKEFAGLLTTLEVLREKQANLTVEVRKGSTINGMMSSKIEEKEQ
jgi:hypothetical protein